MLRIVLLVVLLLPSVPALAVEPAEKVRATIDEVRQIITENKGLSEEAMTDKVSPTIRHAFDFREMSKRCLGKNWSKGSAEQQKEFVDLFSELLYETYAKRVIDNIETSTVHFTDEKVRGDRAIVKTLITSDESKISVQYRMGKEESGWKVYDVVIENIGLVQNYRSEFAGIIRSEGFDGLLTRLREKKVDPA